MESNIRSAPYHPASNGLAERFVQSLKQALKASQKDGRPLFQRLQSFLLKYQTTPHATTGVTPSSLFLHSQTRLGLLKPSCDSHVFTKQGQQKTAHDLHAKSREWFVDQSVMAKNFRPGPDWISGIIIEKLGPLSYLVETSTQQVWRRHVDQLRLFEQHKTQSELNEPNQMNSDSLIEPDSSPTSADPDVQLEPSLSVEQTSKLSDTGSPAFPSSTSQPTHEESSSTTNSKLVNPLQETTRHYPAQDRKPPDRLRL